MKTTILPAIAAAAVIGSANPVWADPLALYGEEIRFDVMRNGKKVGEHVTRFQQDGGRLLVDSRMALDVKLLGITVYGFRWQANETWIDGRLQHLVVDLKDGGNKSAFEVTPEAKEPAIIASNHWYADVITRSEILNSLTGNINKVTITPAGKETVPAGKGISAEAQRYDYSGELTDTSVWYDAEGRWLKLRFKGRDGSEIDYQCVQCGYPSGDSVANQS